jgi:DNA-binding response OmpR family regulator
MTRESFKIVIADPDPDITAALEEYLERCGATVFVAGNRQHALAEIHENNPDVIILERKLPGHDGLDFCRWLKADKRTKQIPVIFLTALDDVVDKVLGLEAGASDYITKPFNLRELQARINAVLRNRRENDLPTDTINDEVAQGVSAGVPLDFPEPVRTHSEQYVDYFSHFLRDVGSQETSDTTQEVQQILFADLPSDMHTALSRVQAALNIYLKRYYH